MQITWIAALNIELDGPICLPDMDCVGVVV